MHSRTPSRLGSESSHQSPFERALYKMQHAGNKITCRRLSEEWDDLHDEQSFQEIQFEKRLWALTAYQWFTNGKQLQSPLHEILTEGRTAGRVLHLHGSQADGWFLAARYPRATIYTVSSSNTTSPPTDWPSPPNHHCLYLPTASFTIPFADNYFDFVVSKTLPKLVHNDQWTSVFQDCMRILKPGGWMEISTLDPHFARQGPTLAEWVNTHIERRLDESGFSTRPSEDVLKTMEDVGLTNLRRAKIALPVSLPLSASRPNVNFQNRQTMQTTFEDPDARRLMVYLGRHFYQDLYSQCLTPQESKHWFWNNKSIRTEFEGLQTGSLLTIACAQKSDGVSH
ncbi:hypothetical protein M501DRAFT_941400 [Patellaria atrata CBS 101060]|uniref:Methyltransferase type 11 domain-containing protein n=1 Tax=Patellaria atrata CBS 101060 TaxID=1346257 RepID=A0A9P4VJV6_9PEZI|nr:hypothetical protein M501DRAFT_941400 [Patellaria atrata CBS 101060]